MRRLAASPETWTWAAIAVGAFCRVFEYLADPPYYMDERYLLLNLVGRPPFDMGRLVESQIAAPAFLVVERLMVRLPMPTSYAGRLVPLLAGLASLILTRAAARRVLAGWAVPTAVALFAMSDYLIEYSAEIKQYSTDVFFTLALTVLALRVGEGWTSRRGTVGLAAAGLAATWSSHVSCFVLAAVGTYLAGSAIRRRDRRGALVAAGLSAAWASSFAACYAASSRMLSTDRFIWDWWGFAFLRLPPRSWAEAEGVGWQLLNVFTNPVGVWTPANFEVSAFLALGLWLIGAASMARARPGALYLLVAPAALVAAASALRKYPFHGRLLLFLAPMAWLLIAGGIGAVGRRTWWGVGALLAGFLLWVPSWDAIDHIDHTPIRIREGDSHGDLRHDLLDYLEARRQAREFERPRPVRGGPP